MINKIETTTSKSPSAVSPVAAETKTAPATLGEKFFLFFVVAIVWMLDQLTKYIIEFTLPLYQSWSPIPAIESFFRITHATNTGAAFGIFPEGGSFFTIVALFVASFIIYYNYTLPAGQMGLRLALGLQLGGAIGNVTDRFRLGHVTDFLDFGPWPIFNLADTSIVMGVVILSWLMFNEQKQGASAKTAVTDQPPVDETTPSDTLNHHEQRPSN